jgi:ABC-type glycerol-3-phosphate transport system substrate-binding protein
MISTGTAITKTVLSLATAYPDSPIMELINNFNRSNENYYIEVFDFSEYLDSGTYSDLYSAWNEAFVAGDIPDMIDFFNLPWHSYADKGFLLDLNAYLGTGNILPWLWDAVKYDGANYTFPSCFAVETLYGKSAALGGRSSWSLDDFLAMQSGLTNGMELFDKIDQNLFMFYVEQYMIDDFINYETATCQFDSEEFISLLNFAGTLGATSDASEEEYQTASTSLKIRRDQVLLEPVVLTSIDQMHDLEEYTIGDEIAWIGWPCANASKIQAMSDVAIMAASKHIEGAIEFLEYLMDDQCQEILAGAYFPITNDIFEETIQQAEADRSTSNTEIATEKTVDGTTYSIVPLSQEKANSYTAWMSTISQQTYYQWDIAAIIDEECEALFAGDKTSEETATLIQNRVSVYLSEQK